jgi:hypothetical protein
MQNNCKLDHILSKNKNLAAELTIRTSKDSISFPAEAYTKSSFPTRTTNLKYRCLHAQVFDSGMNDLEGLLTWFKADGSNWFI